MSVGGAGTSDGADVNTDAKSNSDVNTLLRGEKHGRMRFQTQTLHLWPVGFVAGHAVLAAFGSGIHWSH